MTTNILNLCRRCAQSLRTEPTIHPPPIFTRRLPPPNRPKRTLFTKRFLSGKGRQVLQIPAPDPSSPLTSSPAQIPRDPGLTLGSNGIPVPPPPTGSKKDYTDEKSWAETVFRTLSGGMKSDYLKCPPLQSTPMSADSDQCRH